MSLSATFSTVTLLSLRGTRWCLRALLALVGLAWTILLLAWLVLHWAILPHIDEWRPRLEEQASKALGHPLHIARMTVGAGGWIPALTLQDVSLSDAQGRQGLRLPEIKAVLSLESLLTLDLRFSQLLIEAPELELRRDAQGHVFIAGMPVQNDPASHHGSAMADWFFVQHEFVIRHGRVRWIDEMRGAAPLALDDVDLVVRNGLRRHDLRLDATPPADWGERFSLQGHFKQPLLRHKPSELRYWSGQLYGDLPRVDVRELQRYLNLPFELIEGDGALRTWVDIDKGRPQGMTLDMGLRAVTLRLAPNVQPLTLEQLSGRLMFQRTDQALQLSAQHLSFTQGPDLRWAPSDWSLNLNLADASRAAQPASMPLGSTPFSAAFSLEGLQVQSVDLKASRLDLNGLARIATTLPLGEGVPALIDSLAPRGQLSELSAHWEGPLEALRHYHVKGQLTQFAVNAQASSAQADTMGRPGVRGANLSFDASETGGQAQLLLSDGEVDLPGLFEEPRIALQRLSADLRWRITAAQGDSAPAIELKLAQVQVVNDDVRGDLDLTWRTGAGSGTGRGGRYPGQLELNGRLAEAKAASVARYLPLGVGANVRAYVREAVRAGTARNVTFNTKGDLWDFPFDQGSSGQFRISAQAVDVNLAYVPGQAATPESPAIASEWPAMERVNAELIFDRASMRIQNGKARVLGYELVGVNGGIKDLGHDPTLELDGNGRGPVAELLQFMRASPVGAWTGQALSIATGTGNANLRLALQLPLDDVNRSQVKGSVQLLGNDLRLRPDVPLLAGAKAHVDFDRKGLSISAGSAKVLGGDATFEGGSLKDGSLRFTGQGVVTAEALRHAPEMGVLARLAKSMAGQTAYKLQLGFKDGQSEIGVTSQLAGMALEFPAPLHKDADTPLPLRYQTRLLGDSGMRDELQLELGRQLQARYLRDISGETAQVLRGTLAWQDTLPLYPGSGVQMQARFDSFNADAWAEVAKGLSAHPSDAGVESVEKPADSGYSPTQLNLHAQSLQIDGRKLSKLSATMSRALDTNTWHMVLDAEQIAGTLDWRAARPNAPGRIYARLSHLAVPKAEMDSVTQIMNSEAETVPALDVVVDDLELHGLHVGQLELNAQVQGANHDWQLVKAELRQPDGVLSATGHWLPEPGGIQRNTTLDWHLDLSDTGKFLTRLGKPQVMKGGKGSVAGQIAWKGSPLDLDYASMSGQLKLQLGKGQILKADPGMGRLLGVLSLQSLPRRLLLDFRDVFAEGFAFDAMDADIRIDRGLASTKNYRLRGVQASVLMEGQADLAAQTQNLTVFVVPEVNAEGASLAYAAINPVIGFSTLLAQWLLRKPMASAGTSEFHVTGPWDDPKVEPVPRKQPADDVARSNNKPSAN